jgi:hypothetical protein
MGGNAMRPDLEEVKKKACLQMVRTKDESNKSPKWQTRGQASNFNRTNESISAGGEECFLRTADAYSCSDN